MALSKTVIDQLVEIVGRRSVLTEKEDLIPYSFDGTAAMRNLPGCVVFAHSTEEVAQVLTYANDL